MVDAVPDVSVIVAAYNGVPYVEHALDSLVRQTIGQARMQVLVVDDGSTDGTPAYLDRMAELHPAFTVIHQPNSGGPAAPRNSAMELVRGRYIFFLDQDDYLSDDALEAMVRAADVNGTDVVVARIKGVGGRGTPRSMFTRTMPRTDIFSCQAYWTLNPMKLFRTDMVRRLGLRFDERLPVGEDEPFVATAFIKGDGISVLADKDYVFWRLRDDLSNITTSVVKLRDRMPAVRKLFDLLAGMVPPGARRDGLMRRHFRIELASGAFEGYRTEHDPDARAEAFAEFKRVADAYFTERIESTSPPEDRVLMRLLRDGRAEEFGEYLDALACAGPPPVVVEGDRVYLGLPWFREAGRAIPDGMFEIGANLKPVCMHQPLTVEDGVVRVDSVCRLGALTDRVTDVSLVARAHHGVAEVAIPLAYELVVDETRPFAIVSDTVSADRLLGELTAGTWDLYVRLSAGVTRRERKIAECDGPAAVRAAMRVITGSGVSRSAMLKTTRHGKLALRVVDGTGPTARAVLALEHATEPIVYAAARVASRALHR